MGCGEGKGGEERKGARFFFLSVDCEIVGIFFFLVYGVQMGGGGLTWGCLFKK